MEDNQKVISRQMIAGADLESFEKALRALVQDARCHYPHWNGRSATLIESADGMKPHSFELVAETLSDLCTTLTVRLLFEGDV